MTVTPPFRLSGPALGAASYSLADLGIQDATLRLRSLDVDSLTFTLRDNGARPAIPEDGAWLTLTDDAGQVLFAGITKRAYRYPERIYSFACSNVYQGLMESPLTQGDRAFVLYSASNLGVLLRDIISRAAAAGLPIQAPATMPDFYAVPKMAFRAASIAGALEDALKWAPDSVTRMDYTTTPPTLRFHTRGTAAETILDLDVEGHKTTAVELVPYPEARALAVAFAYARRTGDNIVNYLVQTAGNDNAEARRKVSLYLSGQERTDMLVSEALTTAQKAVAMAQASVDAVGASITAAAASAQISLTWANLLARDSNLAAAVAAQGGFVMDLAGGDGNLQLYTAISNNLTTAATIGYHYYGVTGVALRTSGGSLATGWYPITTGAFTTGELATAGATKETRYIKGSLYVWCGSGTVPAGQASIETAGAGTFTGYTNSYYSTAGGETAAQYYRRYAIYNVNIAVDAINMAPSAVAAAVSAAAAAGNTALITRAEYVEAPADLAQNYFSRQDWTPYKGRLAMTPTAADFPAPGDFINIVGDGTPAEWQDMKVPVAELSLDLRSGAATIAIGPSPRMDFSSLMDRLRIPPEDNYEAG